MYGSLVVTVNKISSLGHIRLRSRTEQSLVGSTSYLANA